MNAPCNRRKGAVLVIVTISMVAAAAAGVAILAVSTSARFERIGMSSASRAYYLAESGAEFVRSQDPEIRTTLAGTNTLANGDQFAIRVWTNAQGWVVVQSTGIANPGTALEAQRQVTVEIRGGRMGIDQTGNTDFYNEDGSFNADAWGISGRLTPTPKDTGPSGGEGALDIQGTEGYLFLNWRANTNTVVKEESTLWRAYRAQTNLLGYDVQVKIQPYDNPGVGFGQHFLHGISFRLQANGACYGLSFFRSLPVDRDNERPAWARDARLDANFRGLRGTNDNVVLWYRTSSNGIFQLIAFHRLVATDPIIRNYGSTVNPPLGITAYSTLLLQLDESRDASSNKINEIAAFIQSPSNCPSCYPTWPNNNNSNAIWQTNAIVFPAPLVMSNGVWTNGVWTNIVTMRTNFDARLSSTNAYSNLVAVTNADGIVENVYRGPPEIGIHMYYDQSGANKKFFDDLAIKIPGSGTRYSGTQIQY